MPFTVSRTGGMPGFEFEPYLRLFHLQGKDFSDLPRVPDPLGSNRWLCAWESEPEAELFAQQLREHSNDPAWRVVAVEEPVTHGPLGPLDLELGRQSTGLTFGLHPISRRMIRKRFPDSCRLEDVFLSTDPQYPFRPVGAELAGIAAQVLPLLTGLTEEQLALFGGFRLIDPVTACEILPAPVLQPSALPPPVAAGPSGGSVSQALR
jgi:hypothetical protein